VSLDLNQVVPQIGRMTGRLKALLEDRQERLRRALDLVRDSSNDIGALRTKIESSTTTWLVAGIGEGLAQRVPPPPLPAGFTAIATDGSHIEVDRHQAVRCFLLNISHVLLRYGDRPEAFLRSFPHVYAEESEMALSAPDGQGRPQTIEGNLLGAVRSVEESRHLADLAAGLPARTTALGLLDGTLMLWGLESYPAFVTDVVLDNGLLRQFDRLRQAAAEKDFVFGSYISGPRSTDVVNAMRVAVCPQERPDCDSACKPGGESCGWLSGLSDADVFSLLLSPGERSAVFSSRSRVVAERYGEHAVHFFYLRLEDEVARIEIPAWVAGNGRAVSLMHALVLDQCSRGQGYPVVLSEAHEQAVVTGADRQVFWQLVEAALVDNHLPEPTTGKSRSKRTRWA
jgi:hypothetical protein